MSSASLPQCWGQSFLNRGVAECGLCVQYRGASTQRGRGRGGGGGDASAAELSQREREKGKQSGAQGRWVAVGSLFLSSSDIGWAPSVPFTPSF